MASLTSALNTVEDQAQITAFFYEHRLAGICDFGEVLKLVMWVLGEAGFR